MAEDLSSKEKAWLRESKKCLKELLITQEFSAFDALLFHNQYLNICTEKPVKYEIKVAELDSNEEYLHRIRISRLKFLGYQFDSRTKQWRMD